MSSAKCSGKCSTEPRCTQHQNEKSHGCPWLVRRCLSCVLDGHGSNRKTERTRRARVLRGRQNGAGDPTPWAAAPQQCPLLALHRGSSFLWCGIRVSVCSNIRQERHPSREYRTLSTNPPSGEHHVPRGSLIRQGACERIVLPISVESVHRFVPWSVYEDKETRLSPAQHPARMDSGA